MDYGKAFRIVRAAFGLRQSALADLLKISASHLSLIEAGKRAPSLKTVDTLATELRIPSALVTLLASSPESFQGESAQNVSDLANALLRLLVAAASPTQQQTLPFEKG